MRKLRVKLSLQCYEGTGYRRHRTPIADYYSYVYNMYGINKGFVRFIHCHEGDELFSVPGVICSK